MESTLNQSFSSFTFLSVSLLTERIFNSTGQQRQRIPDKLNFWLTLKSQEFQQAFNKKAICTPAEEKKSFQNTFPEKHKRKHKKIVNRRKPRAGS